MGKKEQDLKFNKMWHHEEEAKGQEKETESGQDRRRAKDSKNKEQPNGRKWEQKKEECVKMTAPNIG